MASYYHTIIAQNVRSILGDIRALVDDDCGFELDFGSEMAQISMAARHLKHFPAVTAAYNKLEREMYAAKGVVADCAAELEGLLFAAASASE